jgi:hypothetical protein
MESSGKDTVNNFVAAEAAGDFGWPGEFIALIPSVGFPAPAGRTANDQSLERL